MIPVTDDTAIEEALDTAEAADEEQELSYGELLAATILNGEIIITIPAEDEERVKNGIKNFKSKQATKAKEEGLAVDSSTLIFTSVASKEFAGCIDLSIQAKTKGTIKVKAMRIPENDFPD
jgi:hypothetical protein